MAYSAPKRWAHGDIPTAADMNKYSDSLNALHDVTGDAKRNYATVWNLENFSATFTGSDFYLVHRYRWLVYRGDGEIVDPSGAGTTVTISGDGSNYLAYDLDSISWIVPGTLYQVKDCTFCLENNSTSGVSSIA